MSDKALNNAKALQIQLVNERDALRGKIKQIEERLAKTEAFINNWYAYAEGALDSVDSIGALSADSENIQGQNQERTRTTGNSSKEEVAEAARELIKERGRPIPRKELLKLLLDKGLRIEGTDQDKVLSTMLWRMQHEVVSFPRVGYWLVEEPWEPEDYDPQREYEEQEAERQLEEASYGQYLEDQAQDAKAFRKKD